MQWWTIVYPPRDRVWNLVGEIRFESGLIYYPRGMILQLTLIMRITGCSIAESYSLFTRQKEYRNWFGTHLEHSPFAGERILNCHRKYKPWWVGRFCVQGWKNRGQCASFGVCLRIPFDVVVGMGTMYPYGFSYTYKFWAHYRSLYTNRLRSYIRLFEDFLPLWSGSFVPRLYGLTIHNPYCAIQSFKYRFPIEVSVIYVDGDFYERRKNYHKADRSHLPPARLFPMSAAARHMKPSLGKSKQKSWPQ